jgi:hypothetical protein
MYRIRCAPELRGDRGQVVEQHPRRKPGRVVRRGAAQRFCQERRPCEQTIDAFGRAFDARGGWTLETQSLQQRCQIVRGRESAGHAVHDTRATRGMGQSAG